MQAHSRSGHLELKAPVLGKLLFHWQPPEPGLAPAPDSDKVPLTHPAMEHCPRLRFSTSSLPEQRPNKDGYSLSPGKHSISVNLLALEPHSLFLCGIPQMLINTSIISEVLFMVFVKPLL